MALNIVNKLNALSEEMESLLDFMAQDAKIGEDFETYVEENNIKIEKQSQLNIALIEYLLDGKMQDGTRVLDYYISQNKHKEINVINAFKNSVTSVFEITKVLRNGYETYSLTCEKEFCLIPLVKMVNLRGIAKGDFIRARVIEYEDEFYLLEIYDVISSLNFYKAATEAIRCLIYNCKCAFFKNDKKLEKIKNSISDFKNSFEKTFENKNDIITTNKLADELIKAYNEEINPSKYIQKINEYRFFDIKEYTKDDDFIQNAVGGFSSHNCIYDIGMHFNDNEGLYIIPFLGTFNEIFRTFKEKEFHIEGAKDCIKEFLKSDKVPKSVFVNAAKKYENFLDVINFALGTNYKSTSEILERFKGENNEKFSPMVILYNSKIFSEILGIKDENDAPKYENIGRNDPCPCGSGKKYKKCCGAN